MIGAAAGSAWLSLRLTDSEYAYKDAARYMQLSRTEAGDLDLTRLQSPVLGDDLYINAELNTNALRLADGYLHTESRVYAQALKAMRVSEDARAQKAQGTPVLLSASFHNPNPPALRVVSVSSAEPLVMRNRSQSDLDCLTQAVYHEARGEGTDGMRAVAQVVLNRVRHPSYPKTICNVVYQGAYLRTGCQFSFACDGSKNRRTEAGAWRRARSVAEQALNGAVMPSVGSATHFHTTSVSPGWSSRMTRVAAIGTHVFYQFGGPKSRLNKSDSVQPSSGVPVIAAAAADTPPALMTVLTKDESAEHAAAVPVSHVVSGKPARDVSKAIDAAEPKAQPQVAAQVQPQVQPQSAQPSTASRAQATKAPAKPVPSAPAAQ